MRDDDLRALLGVVDGEDPTPEFVEAARARLDAELAGRREWRPSLQEEETMTVTLESTTEARSPRRRWLLAGAAALALFAVIGFVVAADDDAPPPAEDSSVETESEAVRVVREFATLATAGDDAGAGALTPDSALLLSRIPGGNANYRDTIIVLGALAPDIGEVECVDLGDGVAACLVAYIDDWARIIDGQSVALWTARVEGGRVVELLDLETNDEALQAGFYVDYLNEVDVERPTGCTAMECLAEFARLYAADYAASEFFVPRVELTLPEAAG
ncbi:MAG: hypothetical protein AAGD18_11145 [Actinomycetota bacterium]